MPVPAGPDASPSRAVLENRWLGGLLTLIRESEQSEPPGTRTTTGPKQPDQTKHMFSAG